MQISAQVTGERASRPLRRTTEDKIRKQLLAMWFVIPLMITLPAIAGATGPNDIPDSPSDAVSPFGTAVSPIRLALDRALIEETRGPEPSSSDDGALPIRAALLSPPPTPEQPTIAEENGPSPVSAEPSIHSPPARRAIVGPCDATCRWVTGALAVAGIGALVTLDKENNATIGDFTRQVPWLAGLTMTLVAKDRQGLKQLALAGGSSLFATWGLKHIADKERPNASSHTSFPSGHATAGFFGAAFISRRYGPRWGVPAWVLAAYTGATRVYAERHYVDDVVSSLSLGLMSNWLFTTPISERVAVNPVLAGDRLGFSVSVATTGASGEKGASDRADRQSRFRYQWEFGPASVTENFETAPGDGGNPIDFRFDQQNNPLYTAQIALDWFPGSRRQDVLFRFTPFEIRDFGSFDDDTDFAGVTFPSGEDVRSRSVAYDLAARYRRRLFPDGRFDVRVGGGVAVLYTVAGLSPVNRRESVGHLDFVEADDVSILPIIHLHVGYGFGRRRRWILFTEADGMNLGADRYLDATAQLRFRINQRWDTGFGYRYLERVVSGNRLHNTTSRSQYVAAIGYRF